MAPKLVTVAATQLHLSWTTEENLRKAEQVVRDAAAAGANIILLQELFETPYFCQIQDEKLLKWARPFEGHPVIERFQALAKELDVVLPISYFERANNAYYNSIALIDADGSIAGRYRKSHIPDGPGYEEKWYFTPGDTGFHVFETKYARIGPLVCWDQWFPEGARAVALQGADILLYPTAIGSEPQAGGTNSYLHWCRTMLGHAGANYIPVVASNRLGTEKQEQKEDGTYVCESQITFYGGSFIAGPTGEILAQVGKKTKDEFPDPDPEKVEGFITHTFNLDEINLARSSWGLFRDRRPDLYTPLLTIDGQNLHASWKSRLGQQL